MCGIAGILEFGKKEAGLRELAALSSAMPHRGPDGHGTLLWGGQGQARVWHNREPDPGSVPSPRVGMIHRRLSILDLSDESLQPMRDPATGLSVVYNGEMYNYLELKQELSALGHGFSTTGDTEVLLKAYAQWGPEFVARVNGMWAFALLDEKKNRVVLSRDRFGIKPLFLMIAGDSLFFASEIKALAALSRVSLSPDLSRVAGYLANGATDLFDETFFHEVTRLPAASFAVVDLGKPTPEIQPRPYWEAPRVSFGGDAREAARAFRDLFLDAVRVHARSDVPVGTCLSGGLDSSSVVCACELLRREGKIPSYAHSAFGYTPENPAFSEKPFMDAVVKQTGAKMHHIQLSREDFLRAVPEIVENQDEPFSSTSIAVQWAVFRRAKEEGITVMLDGQGADEILAGYHSYFQVLAHILLRKKDLAGFLRLKRAHEKEIGPFPVSMKAAFRRMAPDAVRDVYRALKSAWPGASAPAMPGPFRPGLWAAFSPVCLPEPESLWELLRQHTALLSLPPLLRYEDRNSMFHSMEGRVPFLDYRLVDLAFSLPDSMKISGASTKHVLRMSMEGILPEKVLRRKDKMGFVPAPGLTYEMAGEEILENRTPLEREWFDEGRVRRLFEARNPAPEKEYPLWRIVNAKLWARRFWP